MGWSAMALLLAAASQVVAARVLLQGLQEVRRVLALLDRQRGADDGKAGGA